MRIKYYEQNLIEYVARRLEMIDKHKYLPEKYPIACLIGQEYELLQIITTRPGLDLEFKQMKYMCIYRKGKVIHIRNVKKGR